MCAASAAGEAGALAGGAGGREAQLVRDILLLELLLLCCSENCAAAAGESEPASAAVGHDCWPECSVALLLVCSRCATDRPIVVLVCVALPVLQT